MTPDTPAAGVAARRGVLLAGWGRTAPSAPARLAQVGVADEVTELLAQAAASGRPAVARGLGRAYGDAAQCAGGVVIDVTGLDGIIDDDLDAGWVRAGAGTSLDTLMRSYVPRGWFVPVTPGTRFVTVGGAIAADIHGKNHHRDGSFCSYVTSFVLATPSGVMEVSPSAEPELFWATAGGMGMTGVIVEATVRLVPIETATMRVDVERAADLDECLSAMTARDDQYRYSVAWVDCLARGRRLGRAVLTRAEHATVADLPPRRRGDPLAFDPRVLLRVPVTAPPGLLNRLSMTAFNELWFRRARPRTGTCQRITSYFHPLDAVGDWNRMYGPRGFVQYQMVVPFGAEDALRRVVTAFSEGGVTSFLAVLKRFGPADPGPLSFPAPGWTLALDLPAGQRGLGELLDRLDDVVAGAGGRVYMAKDARMRPELVPGMYPRLAEWQAVCRRVDPAGVLESDLARRLGLLPRTGATPARRTRRRASSSSATGRADATENAAEGGTTP